MRLDWVIETHERVQSTQDIVMEAAREGRSEGFVVQADEQVQGRGRHGRVWESQVGNLFLSILFRPDCPVRDVGQLSLVAGLSLIEVINSFVDGKASLKWPNDVLLDGEKCAGLLLESELTQSGDVEWVVLGLGVNIVSAPSEFGAALVDYADIDRAQFQARFLEVMADSYDHWLSHGFAELRTRWISYAHPQGSPLTVKIGERLEKGTFHDIDAQGNLRLADEDGGLKTITSGEVYL